MLRRMTIDELNDADQTAFVATLGAIYEHSPWIAERAWPHRPFGTASALHAAMAQVVAEAGAEAQLGLVRAHPDLAGRLARAGALAPSSANEQAGLGLDRLSDEEFEVFESLNTAYRARFGFPFVIAVKRHTRASVLAAFHARLEHTPEEELRSALAEIDAIAWFRLEALLAG
jgi:2-oxo-4-hydroxy-4-carboxy-5-ureidoimidazoline decarboxylase